MLLPFVPLTVNTRTPAFRPVARRRVLCVFPRYTPSFGTFDGAFPLMNVRAFMPPQGLLVTAAYLPREWEVRFVDENVAPATEEDFRWADAVFITGMHVQRERILEIARRAHRHAAVSVLGGPSVSACPDWYGEVDILHIGELGDGTDELIRRLDASAARPREGQERYTTAERLPLADFPTPAYHLIDPAQYFIGSVQFSSGCPFRCEFCDIPALYGRSPRLKTPAQVTGELDALLARSNPGAVYFVDDNFIANPRAAMALVEHLVGWQRDRGYPVRFACEATLNISKSGELLALMREAAFTTVFCGIETPEEGALSAIGKTQNLRSPILDAVRTLNSYGMEVVSGIILGLDTDTPATGRSITRFIDESAIPLLTINILHALPKTPLWDRLAREDRLIADPAGRESNVEFKLPYETVVGMWRETVARAYDPDALYARFAHQSRHTFRNRKPLPLTRARLNRRNLARAAAILARVVYHAGLRPGYRRTFWRHALPALARGRVEDLIHTAVVSHHLITFARKCDSGDAEKCFYSPAGAAASRPERQPGTPATLPAVGRA